jgi:hypothetical protein
MPVIGLDRRRCLLRNARAARLGETSVPLRLAPEPGGDGARLVQAIGQLPATPEAAAAKVNALLGREGDARLGPDDLHLFYPEGASTRFIDDRGMFLSKRTLKNIAADALDGFAFMNSHRTGTMSTPSELPYGRTVAGRYETWDLGADAGQVSRVLLGVYLLKGVRPNGDAGPTTDDLAASIRGGTTFDVSMGLHGGSVVCDVCGEDMGYDPEVGYACDHIPLTTAHMTDEEVAAQEARGVPGGVATCTLDDARAGEVSAVYDGAVPGAGFLKARRYALAGRLDAPGLLAVAARFRPYLTRRERAAFRRLLKTPTKGPAMSHRSNIDPDALVRLLEDEPGDRPARALAPARAGQATGSGATTNVYVGGHPAPPAATPSPAPPSTAPAAPAGETPAAAPGPQGAPLAESEEVVRLRRELEAANTRLREREQQDREREEREARDREEARRREADRAAADFAAAEKVGRRIFARSEPALVALHRLCAEADHARPGEPGGTSLVAALGAYQATLPAHDLVGQKIQDGLATAPATLPPGVKVLENGHAGTEAEADAAEKERLEQLNRRVKLRQQGKAVVAD